MNSVIETGEYAVIKTGGKQYRVAVGSIITIEKLPGELKEGDKVTFDEVLLKDDGSKVVVGKPFIEKAKVTAELVDTGRAKKVVVIRYRQKSRHFKKKGHRQPYMKVKILTV